MSQEIESHYRDIIKRKFINNLEPSYRKCFAPTFFIETGLFFNSRFLFISDFISNLKKYDLWDDSKDISDQINSLNENDALSELISKTSINAIKQLGLFIKRYISDKEDQIINEKKISSIDCDYSDYHIDREVYLISFSDKTKILYKSNPSQLGEVYNSIANWVNLKLNKSLISIYKSTFKTNYSWHEFLSEIYPNSQIKNRECSYKLGALFSVLYHLNGCDFHKENIIIVDNEPFLIDYETLFQPVLEQKVNRFYESPLTISEVGLLYSKLDENKSFKDLMFVDEFKNLLSYKEDFKAGFKTVTNCLVENKDSFIEMVHSKLPEQSKCRIVLKPTAFYFQFLKNLQNHLFLELPAFIKKGRELYLSTSDSKTISFNIREKELEQLIDGYIPVFYCNARKNSKFSNIKNLNIKNNGFKIMADKLETNQFNILLPKIEQMLSKLN